LSPARGRTARRRGEGSAVLAVLLAVASTDGAAAAPSAAPLPPPPPLPSLPSIARVAIEVARDRIVVVEEIDLPRGTWRGGDLDLYVAFGAPGAPLAFDAHLLAVADGALEPDPAATGDPIPLERTPRRPASAHTLLGRSSMAGAVLRVHEAALRRALAPGNMAAIRLRTLLPLPAEDAHGSREVVVRLGVASGTSTPLTLGRLQLVSRDAAAGARSADARLCGPEADPYPLAIALTPRPGPPPAPSVPRPVAPVLATRHATDDLCIRFTLSP